MSKGQGREESCCPQAKPPPEAIGLLGEEDRAERKEDRAERKEESREERGERGGESREEGGESEE